VGASKTINMKWISLSGIDIFSDEGWLIFSGTVNFRAVHRVPLQDSQVIVLVSVSTSKITGSCVLKKQILCAVFDSDTIHKEVKRRREIRLSGEYDCCLWRILKDRVYMNSPDSLQEHLKLNC